MEVDIAVELPEAVGHEAIDLLCDELGMIERGRQGDANGVSPQVGIPDERLHGLVDHFKRDIVVGENKSAERGTERGTEQAPA
jgi:hypothetical protein